MQKDNLDLLETYQLLLPKLKSYLYRLTCDREITNDLTQDAFLKSLENIQKFDAKSSLSTWIFSIATNLALDWIRKRNRWSETAQDDAKALAQSAPEYRAVFLNVHQNSPAGAFDIKEHIDFCFTCITKTLNIEHQITLILKDIYDFKIVEISIILKSPAGTIKHWLFNARKTMNLIFDKRCALINKNGICNQCTELNGLFNPQQKEQIQLLKKVGQNKDNELYSLRAQLVKAINPINSPGSDLQDEIMKVLRRAISDN